MSIDYGKKDISIEDIQYDVDTTVAGDKFDLWKKLVEDSTKSKLPDSKSLVNQHLQNELDKMRPTSKANAESKENIISQLEILEKKRLSLEAEMKFVINLLEQQFNIIQNKKLSKISSELKLIKEQIGNLNSKFERLINLN